MRTNKLVLVDELLAVTTTISSLVEKKKHIYNGTCTHNQERGLHNHSSCKFIRSLFWEYFEVGTDFSVLVPKGPVSISVGIVIHLLFWINLCRRTWYTLITFTGLEWQFDILDENIASTQGIPYDYKSVMHLGYTAFAKSREKTILPLKYNDRLTHVTTPTFLDFFHVNILYCGGINI